MLTILNIPQTYTKIHYENIFLLKIFKRNKTSTVFYLDFKKLLIAFIQLLF